MREMIGKARCASAAGRIPTGFLGMIVLMAAVELVLTHFSLELNRPEYWLWYASSRSARHDVAKAEILCLGTSQSSHGIVPQVLQERLGRKTYNLAMCSATPQADYYLLKRVLDAGERPRAVVFDVHPHLMAVGYWGSIRFFPNLLSVGECLDLSWTVRDADFAADVLLAKALPSVLGRFDIRTAVTLSLQGQPCSLKAPTLSSLWNRESNQGALVLPVRTAPPAPLSRTDHEWDLPPSWNADPNNTLYVRRLLKLAAAHDITVFLLIPPRDPRLQKLRDERGLSARFEIFARALQVHHKNLVVVDAGHSAYPQPVFSDGMHLTRPGAVAMTSDLAEVMRPYLDGNRNRTVRWAALPRFSERMTGASIVEIAATNQSKVPWKVTR